MLKKLLWLTILILITACTVYAANGGIDINLGTPTPTQCVDCTAVPTAIINASATPESTIESSPTAEITEATTEVPTDVATVTATETVIPTATATLLPTETATPTFTPTATLTPTSIPMAYKVQTATPVFMTNFAHTDAGCSWQGVAGQVFDKSGNPVKNFVVKITGSYNGAVISMLGVTGMVAGNPYGPGGYEIVLGTTPINSVDTLSVQVFDGTGNAVTAPLKFSTSSDCSKNLVIINFVQN